jgi:ribosomal protein L24E
MSRALILLLCGPLCAAGEAPTESAKLIAALKPYQEFVGQWRGVGQPRRGSNRGAWQEQADVLWQLTGRDTGLVWKSDKGPLWKSARFALGDQADQLALHVTLPDDTQRVYVGQPDGDKLILETAAADNAAGHRITITKLNENRVLWLVEQRGPQQSFYQRVAEIAFQRQGTRLAAQGSSGPECVVTGGLGTIPVTHEGKTYYVCCTGCRDAFHDDPAGILAEWTARRAKEQAKKDPSKP